MGHLDPEDVLRDAGYHPGGKQPEVRSLANGAMYISPDYVPVGEEIDQEEAVVGEIKELLQHITGVNFDALEHTRKTPERFVKMLRELTTREDFEFTVFDNDQGVDEMVSLGPIPYYTLCAHHIVPFYGNAYIGYVPDGSLAGLSKFPRAVRYFSKQLTVQEVLTNEIADYLDDKLKPKGIIVVMEGEHLCMAMRGVAQPGVTTRTTAVRGVFADHTRTAKAEFMAGINGGGR
jgi:GTP cyclohydrolase I